MTSIAFKEITQSQTLRVSPNLLAVVDRAGVCNDTNPAWQGVLGWSEAELRRMVFIDLLHPDDMDRMLAIFDEMMAGAPALHVENRYRCRNGAYRWLSWVAVPEGGSFFCSAQDVTDNKRRARPLETSEDEAMLREEFVAILGHDLRNPLAAIAAAFRLDARQPHEEKLAAMLAAIEGSVGRMTRLIDTTVDFARARLGGGIPLDMRRATDLAEGFGRVIDEIRLAHPDRRIDLTFAFDRTLTCDASRLDQLLSNLVANVVTHGAQDRPIILTVQESDGSFVLSVRNSGNPIPAEMLPGLFLPFKRADEGRSQNGLGLGLYIANQIARAHGGSLSATSTAKETVFRLEIPFVRQA